jgi:quinoprotein dehydrogenase-associated probable ABC transporter substrate-binding protein
MRRGKRKRTAWRTRLSGGRLVLVGLAALALWLQPAPLRAQTSDLVDRSALRVCADPANLPFSSTNRDGFEDKLAALLGETLEVPVLYAWFPQATGFIRNTLRARKCDIVMGYAQGHELVQNTNHYYRSVYVLLYRTDSDLEGVESLDDPRLKGKRIGVVAGTPPATVLALNGLMGHAKPFPLHVDRRYSSPGEDMVAEVASGELDAGLLWGPIGGYYAKLSEVPITVVPLTKETKGSRMSFRITMGIRPNEPDWKHRLNEFIAAHQDEINAILLDYGVPLLDEQNRLIGR